MRYNKFFKIDVSIDGNIYSNGNIINPTRNSNGLLSYNGVPISNIVLFTFYKRKFDGVIYKDGNIDNLNFDNLIPLLMSKNTYIFKFDLNRKFTDVYDSILSLSHEIRKSIDITTKIVNNCLIVNGYYYTLNFYSNGPSKFKIKRYLSDKLNIKLTDDELNEVNIPISDLEFEEMIKKMK